jgi:hypothetical protein
MKEILFQLKAQNGYESQIIPYSVAARSFFSDSKTAEVFSTEVKNQWSDAFNSPYAFISCTGTNLSIPLIMYPTCEG